jgi:hypothetical protein
LKGIFIMNSYRIIFILVLVPVSLAFSQKNTDRKTDEIKQVETKTESEMANENYLGYADLSALGENVSMLFFNDDCFLIGKDNVPYILNASVKFDPVSLPKKMFEGLYDIQSLILASSFSREDSSPIISLPIPKWIDNFTRLKYVTFENIKLDSQFFIGKDSLEHFIILGGNEEDEGILVNNISKISNLRYLVHNGFLTKGASSLIMKQMPGLEILTEEEYDLKLENGEIQIPQ